jgi:glycerophosphoryl diester phosphodiesterase
MDQHDEVTLKDVSAAREMPRIIAHRGARREAPENTITAFQRAIDLGADGIELDVLLTSDKVPVVTHNDDLSILTGLRAYAQATPFDTLRTLDVGSHFGAQFAGTTMPTLSEALELTSRYNILTIVEIKPQSGLHRSAARVVGGIVSDMRMHGPVVVSSSSRRIVRELKRYHPSIPRALVVVRPPFPFFPLSFFVKKYGVCALHASTHALWPSLAAKMKRAGELYAWTINEAQEIGDCISMGVDGIITDDVPYVKDYLGSYRPDTRSRYGQ